MVSPNNSSKRKMGFNSEFSVLIIFIQGDQNVSVHLAIVL